MKKWLPLAAFLAVAMGGLAYSQSGPGWFSYDTMGNLRVTLGTFGLAQGSATGPGWLSYDTAGNLKVALSSTSVITGGTIGTTTLVNTAHNEVQGTDGIISAASTAFNSNSATFTKADVGKTIILAGLGAADADLVTTIAGYVDSHDVTLAAATTSAGPWYGAGNALFAATSTLTGNYAVGDTITVSGGTQTQ